MMKLYCTTRSTFSRRVRIALLEKEMEHTLALVDMAGGAHKSPNYLALNPYGRVPTIEHDGFVLYESTAILGYLEAIQPDGRLFPRDPQDRARVDMHIKLCDVELTRYAGVILFPKRSSRAKAGTSRPLQKHVARSNGTWRS